MYNSYNVFTTVNTVVMMVVPWVLLLVVIVVAAGMICWFKTGKKGTYFVKLYGEDFLSINS